LIERWIGDYGGQKQKFFPANYCEEINYVAEEDQDVKEDEMNGEDDMSEVVILKSYLLTLERHNVFEFLSFYYSLDHACIIMDDCSTTPLSGET